MSEAWVASWIDARDSNRGRFCIVFFRCTNYRVDLRTPASKKMQAAGVKPPVACDLRMQT